jgi:glucose/mannose transport system substrate-binding protein
MKKALIEVVYEYWHNPNITAAAAASKLAATARR